MLPCPAPRVGLAIYPVRQSVLSCHEKDLHSSAGSSGALAALQQYLVGTSIPWDAIAICFLLLLDFWRSTSRSTLASLWQLTRVLPCTAGPHPLCRGGLRTVMVTGDYQHTAIAVAKGVGMLPKADPTIIIQAKSELQGLLPGLGHVLHAREKLPGSHCSGDADCQPLSSSTTRPESSSHASLDMLQSRRASWALPDLQQASGLPLDAADGMQPSLSSLGGAAERGYDGCCGGLSFTLDSAERQTDVDPQQALTSLAPVHPAHPLLFQPTAKLLRIMPSCCSMQNVVVHAMSQHVPCCSMPNAFKSATGTPKGVLFLDTHLSYAWTNAVQWQASSSVPCQMCAPLANAVHYPCNAKQQNHILILLDTK